jgi:hypothetical protein
MTSGAVTAADAASPGFGAGFSTGFSMSEAAMAVSA